jgi:DNA-binding transcriptional regulator GbsR (MarR family)
MTDLINKLTPVQQKFILHWGEMGTRWGINRTVAQLHALLYLAPKPLNAEEISDALGVARSNVSTSLRELQNWGLIKITHVLGDRRDHFEVVTADVYDMFRIVLDERKKREIDPTVEMLRTCVEQAQQSGKAEATTAERLAAMKDFFETMSVWYDQVDQLPTSGILKFVKAGERLRKLFGAGS